MKTEPNQSAFPSPDTIHPLDGTRHEPLTTGLSKREYFAAMAMEGLCANKYLLSGFTENQAKIISECSVFMADALIKYLNEKEEQQ